MKIGVFGNCQAPGFAASVRALSGADVYFYRIQEARTAPADELERQAALLAACDVVFSQPSITKDVFGPLAFGALVSRCKTVVPYPHIAITQLQPDCHYIRPNGGAMTGPMGPYHSALVAAAFQEGLPPERAILLFNKFACASLGYLSVQTEREPLLRDAKSYGYDYAAFLDGRHGVFMHTINHPCINILFETARQGLALAGLGWNEGTVAPRDILVDGPVWPVYEAIADALNLERREPTFQFSSNTSAMTLSYLVSASYAAYRAFGQAFSTPKIDRARQFIRAEVA